MKVSKSKKTVNSTGFAIIRSIPPSIYESLLNNRYKEFKGKYKLETLDKVDDIPELKEVIGFISKDIQAPIPESTPVTIHVGIYTRTASTYIDPPSEKCGFRILFNCGAAETYHMKNIYKRDGKKVDSGLEPKVQHMESNTYFIMGPHYMSDYQIYVDQNTNILIPQMDPTKKSNQFKVRPTNYKRITIVLDYNLESAELLEKISDMSKNTPKIKATPGMSQKKINEQIDIAKKKLGEAKLKEEQFKIVEEKDKSELEKMMDDIVNS